MNISSLKSIWDVTIQSLISIFGFIVLVPLSLVIPKRNNRIVFVGRHNSLFIDNCKHFFLHLQSIASPRPDSLFIVYDSNAEKQLNDAGFPVACFPRAKSIWYLLTANLVIVDSAEWIRSGKYHLTYGSKIIQLWHGVPLKQIELPQYYARKKAMSAAFAFVLECIKSLTGRYPKYEVVVSTSAFATEKAFKTAFNAKNFVDAGYPRNDSMRRFENMQSLAADEFLNTDTQAIDAIDSLKKQGKRVYLYAPTFRKDMVNDFSGGAFDLEKLDSFARQSDFILVLKLHPVLQDALAIEEYGNILKYRSTADVYPVLGMFDALVTDYSSIYFDFLLLDKPIVFFPYDYQNYVANDRALIFDYTEFAPGTVCYDQQSLLETLAGIDSDKHAKDRQKICGKMFSHRDGVAAERLWQYLHSQFIA